MSLYPQRKATRLQGYDYAQSGAYFVTVCTQKRLPLFGTVSDAKLVLNPAGEMVHAMWGQVKDKFLDVELDYFTVMPNHFHAVVLILEGGTALPNVLQWFKTMTTNAYIRGVKMDSWAPFPGKLWQRSYHDHILRNKRSLNMVREYVNSTRWQSDTFFV